ncbi:MAG: hypothetical protein ACRDTC_21970 [Pseudonocardiaceae bacterium]
MIIDSTLCAQREHDARSRRDGDRLVLHVTCQIHEGTAGFTNLVITRKNNTIALNPHADNSCVLTLDDITANVLHDTLGGWLNRTGPRCG